MGEVLNDFKPVFMFNLPLEQNHSRFARQSYLEILRLKEFLEKHLRTRLSGRDLREAVKLGQRRTCIVRELQKLRIEKPRSLSIQDFFLMIQSSLFRPVDLSVWIEETTKVKEQIISHESERKSLRPRLVLTGAPMVWPNYKVLNILEESGADIVADTLCTGAQSCFDPVVTDERGKRPLLRALVNRYVFASICPCFISQTTRISRILELVDECKADGVVNYSLRLCQLFDVENYRIEQTLKAYKIPYINIRTDYSLEDTEQLRIRIEAFLETLY
jgi:benzoyl-CoA reductase/2-hydroxyglutaryl-CoA dehydratase subunit BcrC/BadD/HgdB